MDLSYFISFLRKSIKTLRFFVKYILRLQNRSFFIFGMETSLLEWKLRFQNRSLFSGTEASFSTCLNNSNSKIRLQNKSFVSRMEPLIPELELHFRNQDFNSGYEASNLILKNNLQMKLRFQKRSFDS